MSQNSSWFACVFKKVTFSTLVKHWQMYCHPPQKRCCINWLKNMINLVHPQKKQHLSLTQPKKICRVTSPHFDHSFRSLAATMVGTPGRIHSCCGFSTGFKMIHEIRFWPRVFGPILRPNRSPLKENGQVRLPGIFYGGGGGSFIDRLFNFPSAILII